MKQFPWYCDDTHEWMEDNSFLIDDNVIVNENTNLDLRYVEIT